jgi:hypothetical protein
MNCMKQIVASVLLVLTLIVPISSKADEQDYSPFFVIPDILIYRPIGIVATVVGAGVFTAISPLTAIAQISPPHDAFNKTADILILGPGRFTFDRPVGNLLLVQ